MLIAMADESGVASRDEYFSMAAYVGSEKAWEAFNREWQAALDKHGIDAFHMWQFAGCRGPFKGWTEKQRRALMRDLLLAVASRRLIAYGVCMKASDFRRLSPDAQSRFVAPYMVCFFELVHGLAIENHSSAVFPIDCIYSQQDEFKGSFSSYWRVAKTTKPYGPRLGSLSFGDMRAILGLQAADLLAYEVRHFYQLKETRPDLGMRLPLKVIMAHQRWQGADTLKYLPCWYLAAQAAGLQERVMSIIMSDLEAWGHMYDQLTAMDSNVERGLMMERVLERFRSVPPEIYERPWMASVLNPVSRIAGYRVKSL